jgi:hypothetical protein
MEQVEIGGGFAGYAHYLGEVGGGGVWLKIGSTDSVRTEMCASIKLHAFCCCKIMI